MLSGVSSGVSFSRSALHTSPKSIIAFALRPGGLKACSASNPAKQLAICSTGFRCATDAGGTSTPPLLLKIEVDAFYRDPEGPRDDGVPRFMQGGPFIVVAVPSHASANVRRPASVIFTRAPDGAARPPWRGPAARRGRWCVIRRRGRPGAALLVSAHQRASAVTLGATYEDPVSGRAGSKPLICLVGALGLEPRTR